MITLLWLLATPALAQEPPMQVLVPEFTAASVPDLPLAYMMTNLFADELRARGLEPIPGPALAQRSGATVESCADNPECPGRLLDDWPEVPLVVVGSVATRDEGLDIWLGFYGVNDSRPITELTEIVPQGSEAAFIDGVATQTLELLELVYLERGPGATAIWSMPDDAPPPDDPAPNLVVVGPIDPVGPDPLDPVGPDPVDPVDPGSPGLTGSPTGASGRDPTTPPDWTPPLTEDPKSAARAMGVPLRTYTTHYLPSGKTKEQWMRDARVRTGRFAVELYSGFARGAMDQLYDLRLLYTYEDGAYLPHGLGSDDERSTQVLVDDSGGALRLVAGMGVSYHMNAHVEAGLRGSVVETSQCLRRSYNLDSPTHDIDGTGVIAGGEPQCVEGLTLGDDASAVLGGLLEARVRAYPLGRGVVKPYAVGGLSVLVLPAYEMADQPDTRPDAPEGATAWSWGTQPGLTPVGLTWGGGLMVDALLPLGVFAEVGRTHFPFKNTNWRIEDRDATFGDAHAPLPEWAAAQSGSAVNVYADASPRGAFAFTAGVQLRF